MSELEVEVNPERDMSSRQSKSRFDDKQKQATMSPYFIAQSIAQPESRAIKSTSSQVEKRYHKMSQTSNISNSASNTTSFSDISLYDQHTQCNQNIIEDKVVPSSFQSKCMNIPIESANIPIQTNNATSSSNMANESATEFRKGSSTSNVSPIKSITNHHINHNDDSSHSHTPKHGTQPKLNEEKECNFKNANSQFKKKATTKGSKDSSSSSNSFWEQKVKRMYL